MTIKLVDQESLCYKKICTRSQFEQNIHMPSQTSKYKIKNKKCSLKAPLPFPSFIHRIKLFVPPTICYY